MCQPEQSDLIVYQGVVYRRLESLGLEANPMQVREILAKALELKRLGPGNIEALISVSSPEPPAKLFHTARGVKKSIYGARIVLFALPYISNPCINNCLHFIVNHASRGAEICREPQQPDDQRSSYE